MLTSSAAIRVGKRPAWALRCEGRQSPLYLCEKRGKRGGRKKKKNRPLYLMHGEKRMGAVSIFLLAS